MQEGKQVSGEADWEQAFRADAQTMMMDMHKRVQATQAQWLDTVMAALPEADRPKAWVGYHPSKPLVWHLIVEGQTRATLKLIFTFNGKEIE